MAATGPATIYQAIGRNLITNTLQTQLSKHHLKLPPSQDGSPITVQATGRHILRWMMFYTNAKRKEENASVTIEHLLTLKLFNAGTEVTVGNVIERTLPPVNAQLLCSVCSGAFKCAFFAAISHPHGCEPL